MTHLIQTYGLAVLFLLVALESGGLPLPGETALIAASILASQGHFDIAAVIVVAAAAAILGDNGGYWVGRIGGRALLLRWERVARFAERVLPPSERFFARHGGKTVFIARFVTVLRVTAAWMAGISRMPWWRFFAWNASGGIVWATLVGLVAFYLGRAAADAVGRYGLIGGGVAIVVVVVVIGAFHLWKRRMLQGDEA